MPEPLLATGLSASIFGAAMLLALGTLIAASNCRSRSGLYALSAVGCAAWLGSGWFVIGQEAAAGTGIALYFFTRSTWSYFQTRRETKNSGKNKGTEAFSSQALSAAAKRLEPARVGLWIWDLNNDRIQFTESWSHASGDGADETTGSSEDWLSRIHPNYVAEVRQAIAAHLDGETDSIECDYRLRARDGNYVWVLNRARVERDAQGRVRRLVGCQIDITSIVDVEKRVLHDAYMDRLTGLPNRRAFTPVLERACERARTAEDSFALLFLDLDKFKSVNDTLGHAVGDELLEAAARRLEELKGPSGFVARLGGDEFVVLLQDVGSESKAVAVARGIHESLSRPYESERPRGTLRRQHRDRNGRGCRALSSRGPAGRRSSDVSGQDLQEGSGGLLCGHAQQGAPDAEPQATSSPGRPSGRSSSCTSSRSSACGAGW